MTDNSTDYIDIINDILDIKEFQEMKNIMHHGMNRYDHSLRVSYYSYKVTKKLHLNYKEATRAALLHDFFLEDSTNTGIKDRIKTLVRHPKLACKTASKYIELTDMEKDIIETHMFPITPKVPKYAESWIVDLVDDGVSVYEKFSGSLKNISYATSFIMILLFNYYIK